MPPLGTDTVVFSAGRETVVVEAKILKSQYMVPKDGKLVKIRLRKFVMYTLTHTYVHT